MAETGEPMTRLPRRLLQVFAAAVLLRLLLLPFIHPWDGNTFQTLFAELAAGENPYRSFLDHTLEARSRIHFGHAEWYEYFAYPPLLIYLYWPFAQLAALAGPLVPHYYVPAMLVPNDHGLLFLLLYKLPIWTADLAIGYMLWRMSGGRVWAAGLYLLNPLVVVVSGAWMFDAIPAALTLGALWAFERERVLAAGALLSLAFLAKFYALFLLPAFFLALVWRKDPRAFGLVGVFVGVAALLSAPFLPEVAQAFAFNSARGGGGLTLHQLPLSWLKLQDQSLIAFQTAYSPLLGAIVLLAGLGTTYVLLDRWRPPLRRALVVTLLAFLLFTKVVNEQYALWVLPFLVLALAEARATRAQRAAFHLLWAVPFAYLLVHVPVTSFWSGGHALSRRLLAHEDLLSSVAALAALAFVATLVFALWAYRPRREEAAG